MFALLMVIHMKKKSSEPPNLFPCHLVHVGGTTDICMGLFPSFQGGVYKAWEIKIIQTIKADFSSTKYKNLHSSDQGRSVSLSLLHVTESGQSE